jgi:hypothetical protein
VSTPNSVVTVGVLRSSGMIDSDMGPEGYRGESGDSVDLPPWSDAALVVGEAE